MKHALVVGGWLISTCLTLLVSISTIHLVKSPRQVDYLPGMGSNSQYNSILSDNIENTSILGITSSITSADARPILISNFLERYGSPLQPYDYWGEYLVNTADKYNLDFKLLPAMSMQESNLCKKIPAGTYNCLGLGIHAKGTWGFDSYEANFDKAAEILKNNYIDKGYITLEEIQSKYTPQSNGSWQFAVNQFMNRIERADF